jgi:hypothetical protein
MQLNIYKSSGRQLQTIELNNSYLLCRVHLENVFSMTEVMTWTNKFG